MGVFHSLFVDMKKKFHTHCFLGDSLLRPGIHMYIFTTLLLSYELPGSPLERLHFFSHRYCRQVW